MDQLELLRQETEVFKAKNRIATLGTYAAADLIAAAVANCGVDGVIEELARAHGYPNATPQLLKALQFVAKYTAMQSQKGTPLPSQLVNAVNAAIAAAELGEPCAAMTREEQIGECLDRR